MRTDELTRSRAWAEARARRRQRLAEAAPQLLASLQDMTALYASTKGADPLMIAKAQAAIRKATTA